MEEARATLGPGKQLVELVYLSLLSRYLQLRAVADSPKVGAKGTS
jgi:hypothetical protein